MRDGRIGSPRSSHGDPDSVNNTWTTSAFCDKPGNQLRGPAPQVSMETAPLKPIGMFVTSFQYSPAPNTVPRDWRELAAPLGRRQDRVQACVRDRVLTVGVAARGTGSSVACVGAVTGPSML